MKSANILLGDDFKLKLADFGNARLIKSRRKDGKLDSYYGTRGYMSPELVEEKPYDGKLVDIFAACVILFEMRS